MGLVILIMIIIQVILGIVSNVMKFMKNSSTIVIFGSNTVHKYLGYILVLFSKFQMYLIIEFNGLHPTFWKLLAAIDGFLLLAFILQKVLFPTFASQIMPNYEKLECKNVKSVKELKRD